MKILITGGNGYVGRALCRLLAPNHSVRVIDSLRYGPSRLNEPALAGVELVRADIRSTTQLREALADFQPEAIVHLAAIHFIPECEGDPELAVSTNVVGTVNLLQYCPPRCRFVFASSGAVYHPEDHPHLEDSSPLGPLDVYGLTKLQGEEYTRYFATLRGFPAVVARLFNVVGPGETNPHVLPEIVAQLKAGRTELLLGNLDPRRDYIHVSDAAAGFAALALVGDVPIGTTATVNLGTGQTASVHEILELLSTISGISIRVVLDPARLRRVDRPFLAADTRRIRERFGWSPVRTMADALRDLWEQPDLPTALLQKYHL